jgi:hypothetical protein
MKMLAQEITDKKVAKLARSAAAARKWRKNNPDKVRAANKSYHANLVGKRSDEMKSVQRVGHLRRKYGLTLQEFADMSASQDHACFLCQEVKRLAVDHSHTTGKVRGLLCWNCNTAMGKFKHDPSLLRAAADYIEACRATIGGGVQV